jgi:hypothetical protein
MRGVMLCFAGALLAASFAVSSAAPSPEIQSLLALEEKQNDQCRGGSGDSPATQQACDARDVTEKRLNALGYCYGEPGQYEYQKEWQICASSRLPAPLPLKWSKSLEPDGHVWPDGHTCANVIETPDGFLAVREGPAASYRVVGNLRPNDFIDVAACTKASCGSNPWRQISYTSSGRDREQSLQGWVNARYLHQTACLDEP